MTALSILVVDDDYVAQKNYRRLLPAQKLYAAECGDVGLRALATCQFDCVLLDFLLPDMSGIEFLRQRIARELVNCALVMVTGHDSAQIARRAIQVGVQDFLLKDELSAITLYPTIMTAIASYHVGHQFP